MSDLISVLIPVYNTAAWLPGCLESISGQSYRNFEVILVDDGSSDGSGEVCDRFCGIDSRFRVIHKENGGVSSARNVALGEAKGDYVFFMDSDDIIHPRTFDILLEAINSGPYEMATANFKEVQSFDNMIEPLGPGKTKVFSGRDCIEASLEGDPYLYVIWNHLIPRRHVEGLAFEQIPLEDFLFCYCLYQRFFNDNTIFVDVITYYYIGREGSLSREPWYVNDKSNFRIIESMYRHTSEDNEWCKALMLRKLFRRFLTVRYRAVKDGKKDEVKSFYRPLIQGACKDYYSSSSIPFREKALFSVLYVCPWAVWLMMKLTKN